jgi:hypothetical protein
MIAILRVIFSLAGIATLYIAAFTYEADDKNINSHLAEWWVRLDDYSAIARSTENRILIKIVGVTMALLDGLFGRKLFSLRLLAVSPLFGVLQFLVHASIGSLICWYATCQFGDTPALSDVLTSFISPVCVVLLIACCRSRAVTVGVFLILYVVPLLFLFTKAAIGYVAILLFSAFSDSLVLYFVRRILGSVAPDDSNPKLLVNFSGAIALASIIWIIPAYHYYHNELWRYGQILPTPLEMVIGLNLSDMLVLGAVVCAALILLVHHLFWPSIQRPLYTLQKTGITAHKGLAYTLGLGFLYLGANLNRDSSIVAQILKKFF